MADNLETMNGLLRELETHSSRIARTAKLHNATPAVIMQELSETVMPLLRDFAAAAFAEILSVRTYLHEEVEPVLVEAAGADSMLLTEDAEMIMARLLSYRAMLSEALPQTPPGENRVNVEAELAELDKVLARVAEITLEEGPEEDEDEDEDDEPEEDEATAATKQ